jgi:hypothetical protein
MEMRVLIYSLIIVQAGEFDQVNFAGVCADNPDFAHLMSSIVADRKNATNDYKFFTIELIPTNNTVSTELVVIEPSAQSSAIGKKLAELRNKPRPAPPKKLGSSSASAQGKTNQDKNTKGRTSQGSGSGDVDTTAGLGIARTAQMHRDSFGYDDTVLEQAVTELDRETENCFGRGGSESAAESDVNDSQDEDE